MDLKSYIRFIDAEENELAFKEEVMDSQIYSFVKALNGARPVTINVGMMGLSVGGVAVAKILTHVERSLHEPSLHLTMAPPSMSVDETTRTLMNKALADMDFECAAMPMLEDLGDYTHSHTLLVRHNPKVSGKHKQPFWNKKRW